MCKNCWEVYTCSGWVPNPKYDPLNDRDGLFSPWLHCKQPISTEDSHHKNPLKGDPHLTGPDIEKSACEEAQRKGLTELEIWNGRKCTRARSPEYMKHTQDPYGRFCVLHDEENRLKRELKAVACRMVGQHNATLGTPDTRQEDRDYGRPPAGISPYFENNASYSTAPLPPKGSQSMASSRKGMDKKADESRLDDAKVEMPPSKQNAAASPGTLEVRKKDVNTWVASNPRAQSGQSDAGAGRPNSGCGK